MANLLVNSNIARPLGTKGNSIFALATASVAIGPDSTTGITSILYSLVPPTGSACALGTATPLFPYATTVGPLDVSGTYTITMTPNGDATQASVWSIAVLASNGLRQFANAETSQWNNVTWWLDDMNAAIAAIGNSGSIGPVVVTGVPTAGQVPVATGPTAAIWETVSGGGTTSQVLDGTGAPVSALPAVLTVSGEALSSIKSKADAASTYTPGGTTSQILRGDGVAIAAPATVTSGTSISIPYPTHTVSDDANYVIGDGKQRTTVLAANGGTMQSIFAGFAAMPSNSAFRIVASVVARNGTDSATFDATMDVAIVGGTVTIISGTPANVSPTSSSSGALAWAVLLSMSGSTPSLTGQSSTSAATTWYVRIDTELGT